jgi:hypothetical protein
MDLTMMDRVGDRWEKMEGSCSTGQSPQWAVVPVEEEEEEYIILYILLFATVKEQGTSVRKSSTQLRSH